LSSDEGQAKWDGGSTAPAVAAAGLRADNALRPFGETANPAEYVPRDATETAIREMESAVRSGRPTALTAPPGLGKSLLLHLLASRLTTGFECLFLPYAAVSLEELCAWTLGLLGDPADEDPRTGLLRRSRRSAERGRVLVLLVDDGSSMPLETARELGELIRESGNRLRVVLATTDDAVSSRVIVALHPEVAEVRFTEPMSARETRLYVRTRLEQAGVTGERRERFHEDAIGWIHRLSGGVPRRVHDLGGSLLDEVPEGVGSAWHEERWLGAPIEEVDESLPDDLDDPDLLDKDLDLPETLLDFDDLDVI
jgi:type II secretory pathway predicted ATPase ExeA